MFTIGLDYHLRTSTFCILDANGKTVKTKTIKGDWRQLMAELKTFNKPFQIVFEATCGYGVLYDQLARIAQKVLVAHPKQLALIFRSKRKNDRVDAAKLARLAFLDMVPTVCVPSQNTRTWRELITFRTRQIDKRTRAKNQIRTLLRTYGITKPREAGGLWTTKGLAWLKSLQWPTDDAHLRCDMLLEELQEADARVQRITGRLDEIGSNDSGVALLRTIPGVGPRTAEALVAYIDNPHRFARSKCIGSYFGLVPTQDASAGVNRLGHITREGPAVVRKMICEAGWQARRRDPHVRAYFDRIAGDKRDRRKIALVATGHYLLRCVLAMLKSGETWNPARLKDQVQSLPGEEKLTTAA